MHALGDAFCMTAIRSAGQVLIVEPDSRVRQAFADLVASATDLTVLAACATVDEAERVCCTGAAKLALVSVQRGPEPDFAAVGRLVAHVPVIAVAPISSLAAPAIAAGATAFYDEDGDADALVALIRNVIDRSSKEA